MSECTCDECEECHLRLMECLYADGEGECSEFMGFWVLTLNTLKPKNPHACEVHLQRQRIDLFLL
jgi:hypothetical protein